MFHPREKDVSLSLRFLMDNTSRNFLAVNFSVDKPEKLSTERLTARQREMLMKAKLFRATRLLVIKLTTNTVYIAHNFRGFRGLAILHEN